MDSPHQILYFFFLFTFYSSVSHFCYNQRLQQNENVALNAHNAVPLQKQIFVG